jgi:predicted ABC-type ATPase
MEQVKQPIVDKVTIFDNSSNSYRIIAEFDTNLQIHEILDINYLNLLKAHTL